MRCSGSTGLGLDSFEDITVGVDPSDVNKDCVSYDRVTSDDIIKAVGSKEGLHENIVVKIRTRNW